MLRKPHKYGPQKDFFKISHKIIELKAWKDLTPTAAKLYTYLCHCRNRHTQRYKDYFFRSDRQIKKDTGFAFDTIIKGRKELNGSFINYVPGKGKKRSKYQIMDLP